MLPNDTRRKSPFNSIAQPHLGKEAGQHPSIRDAVRSGPLLCPHCGDHGISRIQKLLLGPIFSCRCSKCGGLWRISKWSIAVALASVVAIPILLVLSWVIHLLTPDKGSVLIVGFIATIVAAKTILHVVPVRKG